MFRDFKNNQRFTSRPSMGNIGRSIGLLSKVVLISAGIGVLAGLEAQAAPRFEQQGSHGATRIIRNTQAPRQSGNSARTASQSKVSRVASTQEDTFLVPRGPQGALKVVGPEEAKRVSDRGGRVYRGFRRNRKSTVVSSVPRLVKLSASSNARNAQATYYFTVDVPETAQSSLKALRIEQLPNAETVTLRTNSLQAFEGTRFNRRADLGLSAIGGPDNPGEVTVVFSEPVQPGQKVTVGVRPRANPSLEGIYQYRVTAFSDDAQSVAQPLGIGRLTVTGD